MAATICGMTTETYLERIRAFHGHLAPGMVCGGFMVDLAYRHLPEGGLFDAIAETRACLPDAIQVLTPCTIGNGWLKIIDTGRFAIALYDKYTGIGVRVSLDPDRLSRWPETEIWAMKKKPKKEQDKDRLFGEILSAGPDLYKVEPVRVDLDGFPKKGKISVCTRCGESFRGSGETAVCAHCSGQVPFTVGGIPGADIAAVPVESAEGRVALHDMTRIMSGVSKEPAFLKGDALEAPDVELLKSMGKNRVYVMSPEGDPDGMVHENDAALAFAGQMAGTGVAFDPDPREGKVDLKAGIDGVLCVDLDLLRRFNRSGGVMCASRSNHTAVRSGMVVAGTRAIPLYLSKAEFDRALSTVTAPVFSVAPYRLTRLGLLITGSEVAEGRIEDGFGPILTETAEHYGLSVIGRRICADDRHCIAGAARDLIGAGADVLVVTGGLSVDPDDVTREALLDAGLVDAVYGAPVLPGAMTLVGRINNTRVIGVPAGALYFERTAFDLLFPLLLADLPITRADLADLGAGGFLDSKRRKMESVKKNS